MGTQNKRHRKIGVSRKGEIVESRGYCIVGGRGKIRQERDEK